MSVEMDASSGQAEEACGRDTGRGGREVGGVRGRGAAARLTGHVVRALSVVKVEPLDLDRSYATGPGSVVLGVLQLRCIRLGVLRLVLRSRPTPDLACVPISLDSRYFSSLPPTSQRGEVLWVEDGRDRRRTLVRRVKRMTRARWMRRRRRAREGDGDRVEGRSGRC